MLSIKYLLHELANMCCFGWVMYETFFERDGFFHCSLPIVVKNGSTGSK